MLYLNAFLCLNCLVQAVIVTPAQHDTAGKFVYDQNLPVFYNVVYIPAHNADCFDRLVDMVQQRGVFHIHQVFHAEIFFRFFHTALCKRCRACFFVHNKIAVIGFFRVFLFVHLGNFVHLQGSGKIVCAAVHIRRLFAAAADDQRCTRLVYQNGVNFVHNSKVMAALHLLLFVKHHIISKIVKSHLIVGAVSNVAVICLLPFGIVFFVDNQTCGQAEKTIEFAHPFAVTLSEVIVYGNDMNALALQRVEVGGQRCHKRFAFAGFHFGNSALMQNNAADYLHAEMLHAKHAPRCLAANGKSIRQDIVQRFTGGKPVFQDLRLRNQFFIAHRLILAFQGKHLIRRFGHAFYFFF